MHYLESYLVYFAPVFPFNPQPIRKPHSAQAAIVLYTLSPCVQGLLLVLAALVLFFLAIGIYGVVSYSRERYGGVSAASRDPPRIASRDGVESSSSRAK